MVCRLAIITSIVLLILASNDLAAQSSGTGRYMQDKTYLFTMGSDNPYSAFTNEDRSKLAIANFVDNGKKTQVWWGTEQITAKNIAVLKMIISPDGARLACVGVDTKSRKHVWVDGQKVGKYPYLFFDTVVFSPDSKRYAFAISESRESGKKTCRVICDGKKSEKYHSIVGAVPTFSPDSRQLVYFARKDTEWFALTDETEGPSFLQTGWGPCFSPDGSQMAYVGIKKDGQYLVVNGELLGPYPEVREVGYSPTTVDLVYIVGYGDSSRVFYNHHPYGGDYHHAWGPTFSSDGRRFAFLATGGIRDEFLIVDSVERRRFADTLVSTPSFSDSGTHFYNDVTTDSNLSDRWLVVDDSLMWEMHGAFEILDVRFSPDGQRFGVVWDVNSTEQVCVVEGQEFPGREWYGQVVFSPDSRRYSVVAGLGGETRSELILDGKTLTPYQMVYPGQRFTPDSELLAYVAADGEKQFLVIGDQAMERFDRVYPKDVEFGADGNLMYFGVKDRAVYKVTVSAAQ